MTGRIKQTIAAIIEKITGKCRFRTTCDGYRTINTTCNKEAGPYCGKYQSQMEGLK